MSRLFGRGGNWLLLRSFLFEEICAEARAKAECLSGRLGYLSRCLLLLLLLELLEALCRLVARRLKEVKSAVKAAVSWLDLSRESYIRLLLLHDLFASGALADR